MPLACRQCVVRVELVPTSHWRHASGTSVVGKEIGRYVVRGCHVDKERICPFKELEEGLLQLGLVGDARWLNQARSCCYTTSSEMLGELGAMVQRIHRSIPQQSISSLSEDFAECEAAVQIAWPNFTLGNL